MWLFGDISSAADNKYHRTVDGSSISRRKFQPIRWVYLGDSLNNGDGKIAGARHLAISSAICESAKLSVSSPVLYSAVSDWFITFFFSKIYILLFLFRLDYQPGEIQLHWIRVGFGNPGGWFRLRNPSGALINIWLATMIFITGKREIIPANWRISLCWCSFVFCSFCWFIQIVGLDRYFKKFASYSPFSFELKMNVVLILWWKKFP